MWANGAVSQKMDAQKVGKLSGTCPGFAINFLALEKNCQKLHICAGLYIPWA